MHPNAQPLEEAQRQLNLMLQQQEELAPGLYRDLALYLQVLREGLLPAVQQACFHLATQVVPERYGQLPQERRVQFQQRLAALVQRCSVLLTVEQLMSLAAQQQRREHRRRSAGQQRLLESFLNVDPAGSGGSATDGASAQAPAPFAPPGGSIHLGLELPVSADLFDRGIPGLQSSAKPGPTPQWPQQPPQQPPPQPPSHSTPPNQESAAAGGDAEPPDLQVLQSLFQLAAEGLNQERPPGDGATADAEQLPPSRSGAPLELALAARLALPAPPDPRSTGSQLPRDPQLQLLWWRHFDRALSRRLRNLSHALNVEMMRLGLAHGLLPLNLLDAVLEGQVEAQPAPANLLRLPLPLGDGSGSPADVLALLLRASDLEYEQPRLRTCRKRLEQRRLALRTMAKRFRIWQRRVKALEAEQQWFRDSAQLQNRPLPPS